MSRVTYIDLHGRLCIANLDGSRPQCLSQEGLFFQNPAWSPDGSSIAAIGTEAGGAGVYRFNGLNRLFRKPTSKELYFGQVQPPLYLRWGPDGSRLGFLVGYPQSIALYLTGHDGEESRLLETGQPFFWDWMPDGAYLIIHTGGRGSNGRLLFIDQDGEDWGNHIDIPGYFQAPAISSDGRYWAFAVEDETGQSCLAIEHHLSGERLLIEHSGAVAMGWQPGGHLLAYIAPTEDQPHYFGPLRLLDSKTGQARTMTDDVVLAFFWSPDGKKLAYLTLADGIGATMTAYLNLWVMDVKDSARCIVASFQPPTYFVEQFLPLFDQYGLSHRLWSADSTTLVMSMVKDSTACIVAVPAVGGPLHVIAEGIMPSCSH